MRPPTYEWAGESPSSSWAMDIGQILTCCRFREEAQILGRPKHPHIITILDAGDDPGAAATLSSYGTAFRSGLGGVSLGTRST